VAIGGPAGGDAPLADDDQPVSVGQRQRLIAEFLDQPAGFGQFLMIETLNGKD
jgi:hypothetical protein